MSDLDSTVLAALRIFGPCSNFEVARRLLLPAHRTYAALQRLTNRGLAVHPKKQVWDVSDAGRRTFRQVARKPLALFSEGTDE